MKKKLSYLIYSILFLWFFSLSFMVYATNDDNSWDQWGWWIPGWEEVNSETETSQMTGEDERLSNISKNKPDTWFRWNPTDQLEGVFYEANKDYYTREQITDINWVTSKVNQSGNPKFTISNTFLRLADNIHSYLQYIVYFWIFFAIVFVILNGLKLIQWWEKWMAKFKDNMITLVKWIVLLTAFYYIIDVFVSIVNLITWSNE